VRDIFAIAFLIATAVALAIVWLPT